jgi:hypothetical protein
MQAVEIAVFLGIAIIVGSLIVGFIAGWDAKETYHELKEIISPESKSAYYKTDKEGFVVELHKIWKDCGYGEFNRSVPIYVIREKEAEEDQLTKEYVFSQLKKLNWCSSIQSNEFDCGDGEDLIFESIFELPSIVSVSCINQKLVVR